MAAAAAADLQKHIRGKSLFFIFVAENVKGRAFVPERQQSGEGEEIE